DHELAGSHHRGRRHHRRGRILGGLRPRGGGHDEQGQGYQGRRETPASTRHRASSSGLTGRERRGISRLVDDSADGPEGSPYLPRIERTARRSAGAERGEGGFEDRGLFVGERGGPEAAALVGGGETGHRGGRGGHGRLHAERELTRRLRGSATIAAPGKEP